MTLCITLLTITAAAGARAEQQQEAVLLLLTAGEVTPGEAGEIRQAMVASLATAAQPQIAPAEVDRRLAALDPSCTSAECLGRVAKALDCRLLVGGRLGREGPRAWTLSLWLFDAEKRSTVATLRDQCGACDLSQAAAWSGRVVLRLHREGREADLTARIAVGSHPAGASVSIDGTPVGISGMVFGVTPGRHTVSVRLAGHELSVHEVVAKADAVVRVDAQLERARDIAPAPRRGGVFSVRTFKWVTLGVAVAGLASGIALIALHGREDCDKTLDHYVCPRRFESLAPGVVLAAVGGLSAAASITLFYRDSGRGSREPAAALVPTGFRGGAGLSALLTY
jgi:hypothetical protein